MTDEISKGNEEIARECIRHTDFVDDNYDEEHREAALKNIKKALDVKDKQISELKEDLKQTQLDYANARLEILDMRQKYEAKLKEAEDDYQSLLELAKRCPDPSTEILKLREALEKIECQRYAVGDCLSHPKTGINEKEPCVRCSALSYDRGGKNEA